MCILEESLKLHVYPFTGVSIGQFILTDKFVLFILHHAVSVLLTFLDSCKPGCSTDSHLQLIPFLLRTAIALTQILFVWLAILFPSEFNTGGGTWTHKFLLLRQTPMPFGYARIYATLCPSPKRGGCLPNHGFRIIDSQLLMRFIFPLAYADIFLSFSTRVRKHTLRNIPNARLSIGKRVPSGSYLNTCRFSSSLHLKLSWNARIRAGLEGLEPSTYWLTASRSANWAIVP